MKTVCIKTIKEEMLEFIENELAKLPINICMSRYRFKTFDNLIIHYLDKDYIDEFYEIISYVIKLCIEKYYEVEIIKKNVENNYFYLSKLERNYIIEISKKVLELPDSKIGNKNVLLKNLIKNYLLENKKIVLEGFINFRIKEYKELLDKIVEVSVFSYLDLITF